MNIPHTLARNFKCYSRKAAKGASKYLDPIPDGLEYFVLGSTSAASAYDFQYFGVNGFNGAVGPQTVSYDCRLLEKFYTKIKRGGIVIWSPCVFSLCVAEYDNLPQHLRYYYVLDSGTIHNWNKITEIYAVVYPLLRLILSPIKCFLWPLLRFIKHELVANPAVKRRQCGITVVQKSAEGYCCGWCNEFKFDDEHISGLSDMDKRREYCLQYLRKIIELCRQNQLRFAVVIPPVSKSMLQYVGADDLERYLLRPLRTLGDDLTIMNYFDDGRFIDDKLFETAICMNETGRRLFTKEIIERIGAENK